VFKIREISAIDRDEIGNIRDSVWTYDIISIFTSSYV